MISRNVRAQRRSVLPVSLAGAVAYGAATWLLSMFPLAVAEGVDFRLSVAIPIVLGLLYGPWVGFIAGAGGNLIGDFLSGYIEYPPVPPSGNWALDVVRGYVLHWQVGNGIMGLVPGLLARRYGRYADLADQLVAFAFTVVGVVGGMAFASFTGMVLDGSDFSRTFGGVFVPASIANLASAVILVPLVLYVHSRLARR